MAIGYDIMKCMKELVKKVVAMSVVRHPNSPRSFRGLLHIDSGSLTPANEIHSSQIWSEHECIFVCVTVNGMCERARKHPEFSVLLHRAYGAHSEIVILKFTK